MDGLAIIDHVVYDEKTDGQKVWAPYHLPNFAELQRETFKFPQK